MKKCKLVQNIMNFKFCYIIFCTIICLIALPVSTFARENSNNVIRVGSFEETYNTVNEKGERSGYGIMVCALVLYLYISPVLLVAVFLVTIPPLVLPRRMNAKLKQARDDFSRQMAAYTQQLKELLGGFELIRAFLREDAYDSWHRAAAHQAEENECTYQQSLNAVIVNTSLISNLIFPIYPFYETDCAN